jgi:hypothetical protein
MRTPMRDRRNPKSWLGFALVLLAGSVACSVDPLTPGSTGGTGGCNMTICDPPWTGAGGTTGSGGTTGGGGTSGDGACANLPIPAIACAVGRTVPVCTIDASGQAVWKITCPDDPTGNGGAAGGKGGTGGGNGGAGGGGGAPCASSNSCASGEVCTTEDGDCKAPPGCGPGVGCPAVCYGNCRPAKDGPACGTVRCAAGMVCCNDSCGICTPPNGGCTKQLCVPPAGACARDADCRLEADYCTGCDCRALATNQKLPACPGPGVACLIDPCDSKKAQCVNGACAVAP